MHQAFDRIIHSATFLQKQGGVTFKLLGSVPGTSPMYSQFEKAYKMDVLI